MCCVQSFTPIYFLFCSLLDFLSLYFQDQVYGFPSLFLRKSLLSPALGHGPQLCKFIFSPFNALLKLCLIVFVWNTECVESYKEVKNVTYNSATQRLMCVNILTYFPSFFSFVHLIYIVDMWKVKVNLFADLFA